MGFQDEMRQMFLRVAAGEIEPEEWGTWWNSNRFKLEETLTRGDRGRIMPALWSANYYWMTKTQGGDVPQCTALSGNKGDFRYTKTPGRDPGDL